MLLMLGGCLDTGQENGAGEVCGNGVCGNGENVSNCPADCDRSGGEGEGEECEPSHHTRECRPSNGNILWKDNCGDWTNDTYQRCCTGCRAGDNECPVSADENNCCPGEANCP